MAWYWWLCGWIIAGACVARLCDFRQKDGEYYVCLVVWPLVVLLLIGESIAKLIEKMVARKE